MKLEQILPDSKVLTFEDMSVTLAKDRSHPYTFETIITVPAGSTTKFSIQVYHPTQSHIGIRISIRTILFVVMVQFYRLNCDAMNY